MPLAAVTEISLLLSSQHGEAAVSMYISSASSSHFILLRALLPQGAKLPALMCQSSRVINRPTLEKLQSLSCLARCTGIISAIYLLTGESQDIHKKAVLFHSGTSEGHIQWADCPAEKNQSTLALLYEKPVFVAHWGCVHCKLHEGRPYLRPILDI